MRAELFGLAGIKNVPMYYPSARYIDSNNILTSVSIEGNGI